jgi:response regulator of citrate/malate metabolism
MNTQAIGVNQIIIIIISPHSDLTHVNMSNRLGELLRLIQPFSLKKKKKKLKRHCSFILASINVLLIAK